MNPIVQEALGSVIRFALAIVAGYMVKAGIWSASDATTYVTAATLGLLSLGWSLWQKYRGRLVLLTALAMPAGKTENEAIDRVVSGAPVPIVTTLPDVVPVPVWTDTTGRRIAPAAWFVVVVGSLLVLAYRCS